MLRIRKQQNDALAEATRRSFEDRMVVHLKKCFPEHFKAIEEDGARALIRHGIERAGEYGIVAERDVCKYIDLMVIHGPDFDTDDRYPWAGEILNDQAIKSPTDRIERLYDEALARLEKQAEQEGGGA